MIMKFLSCIYRIFVDYCVWNLFTPLPAYEILSTVMFCHTPVINPFSAHMTSFLKKQELLFCEKTGDRLFRKVSEAILGILREAHCGSRHVHIYIYGQ